MRLFYLLWLTCLLSGCVSQIPFSTVRYEGTAGPELDRSAAVEHNEIDPAKRSTMLLLPVGAAFIPLAISEGETHEFNKGHQAELAAHLRSELDRLRVFRTITMRTPDVLPDILIRLEYKSVARGVHNSFAMSLTMTITGGRSTFSKDYLVISDAGDPTAEKWSTNASEGKIKLVRRLLKELVPDIVAYAQSAA